MAETCAYCLRQRTISAPLAESAGFAGSSKTTKSFAHYFRRWYGMNSKPRQRGKLVASPFHGKPISPKRLSRVLEWIQGLQAATMTPLSRMTSSDSEQDKNPS